MKGLYNKEASVLTTVASHLPNWVDMHQYVPKTLDSGAMRDLYAAVGRWNTFEDIANTHKVEAKKQHVGEVVNRTTGFLQNQVNKSPIVTGIRKLRYPGYQSVG